MVSTANRSPMTALIIVPFILAANEGPSRPAVSVSEAQHRKHRLLLERSRDNVEATALDDLIPEIRIGDVRNQDHARPRARRRQRSHSLLPGRAGEVAVAQDD